MYKSKGVASSWDDSSSLHPWKRNNLHKKGNSVEKNIFMLRHELALVLAEMMAGYGILFSSLPGQLSSHKW